MQVQKPVGTKPPFPMYVVNVSLARIPQPVPIAYTLYREADGEVHSNWWVHNTDDKDPELVKISDTLTEADNLIILGAVTADANVPTEQNG